MLDFINDNRTCIVGQQLTPAQVFDLQSKQGKDRLKSATNTAKPLFTKDELSDFSPKPQKPFNLQTTMQERLALN